MKKILASFLIALLACSGAIAQTAGPTNGSSGILPIGNGGTGTTTYTGTAGSSLVLSTSPTITGLNSVGTTAGGNATAGSIGEVLNSVILVAATASVTTATPANITTLSLTAGDWDVSGDCAYVPASSTSITQLQCGIGTTTATIPLPADGGLVQFVTAANVFGANTAVLAIPTVRVNLSATTTIYLVTNQVFTVSTMTAYGGIRARRVR